MINIGSNHSNPWETVTSLPLGKDFTDKDYNTQRSAILSTNWVVFKNLDVGFRRRLVPGYSRGSIFVVRVPVAFGLDGFEDLRLSGCRWHAPISRPG